MFNKEILERIEDKIDSIRAYNYEMLSTDTKVTPTELIRNDLGMLSTDKLVQELERDILTKKEFWDTSKLLVENKTFQMLVDVVILTYKDKVITEGENERAVILNKGAIDGLTVLRETIRKISLMGNTSEVEKLEGLDKFKSF